MQHDILAAYAEEADALIPSFEAISSVDVLAPVMAWLPPAPGRIIDIGAGTGRDAAWLAALGHAVLAVEPVAGFREAGMRLHAHPCIRWCEDTLPALERVTETGFDLILMVAAWHHIAPEDRQPSFRRLRQLVPPDGRLLMSIRHGPGHPARTGFESDAVASAELAISSGFSLLFSHRVPSVSAANREAGVTWTWLGLRAV
ncbi:methyltransferase domain-containing protein [Pseudoxanthomonas beigongshangi]